jgi:hypothetical protein
MSPSFELIPCKCRNFPFSSKKITVYVTIMFSLTGNTLAGLVPLDGYDIPNYIMVNHSDRYS